MELRKKIFGMEKGRKRVLAIAALLPVIILLIIMYYFAPTFSSKYTPTNCTRICPTCGGVVCSLTPGGIASGLILLAGLSYLGAIFIGLIVVVILFLIRSRIKNSSAIKTFALSLLVFGIVGFLTIIIFKIWFNMITQSGTI